MIKGVHIFLLLLFTLSFLTSQAQSTNKDYLKADSLLDIQEFEKSIPFYEEALKSEPGNENSLRGLGYAYLMLGDLDKSEKFYTQALTVNPSCSRCYMNLGNVYASRNDMKKALSHLDKAINLDPKDTYAYTLRGRVKEASGDKFGALRDHNKAVELAPTEADPLFARGDYNLNSRYYSLALSDFSKGLEIAPHYAEGYYKRANVYFSQGMMQEALADMDKAIELDSVNARHYTARGAVFASLNEYGKALSDYNRSIELEPNAATFYNRAQARYQFEDMDGSCADMIEGLEMARNNGDSDLAAKMQVSVDDYCDSSKASYFYQRGIALYNLGHYDKAVEMYSRGLHKFPESALTLSFRGNAYLAMGEFKKAITDYELASVSPEKVRAEMIANPKFASAPSYVIDEYCTGFRETMRVSIAECKLALGDHKGALEDINKVIESAPVIKDYGPENYYSVRGNVYLALGRYKEALEDFDKCIIIAPSYAPAYLHRAIVRINLANPAKMIYSSVHINNVNGNSLSTGWMLPAKVTTRKSNTHLEAALADCNNAVQLAPDAGYAYYIRGYLKQMLAQPDYCYDYLKAKTLSFMIDEEILKGCMK